MLDERLVGARFFFLLFILFFKGIWARRYAWILLIRTWISLARPLLVTLVECPVLVKREPELESCKPFFC